MTSRSSVSSLRSGLRVCSVSSCGSSSWGPLLLVAWFVVRRDRPAIVGFVAIGLAITAATLVLAGMDSIADFMGIARSTASAPFLAYDHDCAGR